VYRRSRIDPILLPRNAGSWPATSSQGAAEARGWHFGLAMAAARMRRRVLRHRVGQSQRAGIDGGVRSYVEYLFEVARTR